MLVVCFFFFFFQAEDGIRDRDVTGVQTCALPICRQCSVPQDVERKRRASGGGHRPLADLGGLREMPAGRADDDVRSEEHTSELQSHHDLVCRLLLEKKNSRKGCTAKIAITASTGT